MKRRFGVGKNCRCGERTVRCSTPRGEKNREAGCHPKFSHLLSLRVDMVVVVMVQHMFRNPALAHFGGTVHVTSHCALVL
ncbi:hypothetical protein E2C01_055622 [Portunus trituberculatus]|uniref:Uncharacterized protein n=1 Tax=Portunus trituberculatus TaxID=210409 RepID=A0A5B7GVI2_PORTR|nr:hypothetical protein [Portunus trituberculatus]